LAATSTDHLPIGASRPLVAPAMRPRTKALSGLAALGWPTISLAILLTSYFYTLPLGRYSVGEVDTDYRLYDMTTLVVGLALTPRLFGRLRELGRLRVGYWRWIYVFIIVVWLSLILTVATGNGPTQAILRAVRFSTYLLTAAAIPAVIDNPARYRFLLGVFWLNIVVQSLIASAQGLGLMGTLWPSYWLQHYAELPVGTLSPHHKHIGVVMMLGMGLSLGLLSGTKSWTWRVVFALSLAPMIFVPVVGGTRSAFLGAGAMVAAFVMAYRQRVVWVMLIVGLVLGAVTVLGGAELLDPMEDSLQDRVSTPFEKRGLDGLAHDRSVIYFERIPKALDKNPQIILTGTGFENASTYLAATGAHNNYIHAWFELGIIGFTVFLIMLWRITSVLSVAAKKSSTALERAVARGAWAAFWGVLASMFVGETLWAQYSMFTLTGQIMAMVGLAVAPLNWAPRAAAAKKANAAAGKNPKKPKKPALATRLPSARTLPDAQSLQKRIPSDA
jgi:hypothetical protein